MFLERHSFGVPSAFHTIVDGLIPTEKCLHDLCERHFFLRVYVQLDMMLLGPV